MKGYRRGNLRGYLKEVSKEVDGLHVARTLSPWRYGSSAYRCLKEKLITTISPERISSGDMKTNLLYFSLSQLFLPEH